MTVAHIAFQYGVNNTGGAAIASTRLHQALLKHGVESHYICVYAREKSENVHELPRGWKRKLFLALAKLVRCIWKFTPYRRSICLNLIPMFGLEAELKKIEPDVVHVQWMSNDTCSFEQLARLPHRIVFNLHDLFVLNAINPYPCQDQRFMTGFDKSNSTRLERWLFNRKRQMVEALHPSFIGPSEWVCNECRASVIGKGYDAYAIPNLPDPLFAQKHAVATSVIATGRSFTVLFGAYGGRVNKIKGFEDLVQALKRLPTEMKMSMELHVFGESSSDSEIEGVKTHFLGEVSTPSDLIKIYQSADVFAFPSREETQGMTKIEAMLCGLPVIAFNRTACAEGIEHGVTGWVASDFAGFAAGLEYFYLHPADAAAIASHARKSQSTPVLIDRIMQVYSAK